MAGKGKIHGEISRNSTNKTYSTHLLKMCRRNSLELLVSLFRTQNKYVLICTANLITCRRREAFNRLLISENQSSKYE